MIKIFVEGKGDKIFLKAYIEFLLKEGHLNATVSFEFIDLKGWTNIGTVNNTFIENSDFGGINLVILDADHPSNQGGYTKRLIDIEAIKSKNALIFDLFLFPNNETDGDFETLLEAIVNQKHNGLLKCFTAYEDCIAKHNLPDAKVIYNLPIRKSKIYSYIDAFPKSRSEKEKFKLGDYFFANPELWNLYSASLDPLKSFLLQAFSALKSERT
jgi:hypothetical protein